jgi:hypothetical protein
MASLRSENIEMKSAVEMTPRGKPGKLPKRVSHPFHRAWKSGKEQRRRISTFPPRRRRVSFSGKERRKDDVETKFQLTDPGHFKHHNNASVASLRKRPPSRRNE